MTTHLSLNLKSILIYLEKTAFYFISKRSDFHMTNSLLIAVHAFASRELMWFSVDETLLPR